MITIGLIGRTNVGKSTLFNRLVGTHRAIVTDIPGTTRELLVEEATLYGKPVFYVDSPGLLHFEEEKEFLDEIIERSDFLLFVVDGKAEIGEYDQQIVDMIRESGKAERTILVVNKLDGKVFGSERVSLLADWYSLGFGEISALSAEQSEGLEELGEMMYSMSKDVLLSQENIRKPKKSTVPIAIIGRPNVGKSTLMNKLIGETVSHVKDEPGTTLDYLTSDFLRKGTEYRLYDTAGIRRKKKIVGLERIAYAKTISMIDFVQPVIVFLLDIVEGVTHRDKSLLGEMINKGLPIVLVFNKSDTKDPHDADLAMKYAGIRERFSWIPFIKISAQEGFGLDGLMQSVKDVHKQSQHRCQTAVLNDTLQKSWLLNPPKFPKNKVCRRKYISQVGTYPPTFQISVNNKAYANFAFQRRVEKQIRKLYAFSGSTLKIRWKSKVEDNPFLQKNK